MTAASIYKTAISLEREGDYASALPRFRKCLELKEYDRCDVLFHIGWCLEQKGEKEDAIFSYREAAELDGDANCRMNSAFRAGWLLMHTKDYSRAAELYRKAIDLGEYTGIKDDIYQNAAYWYALCQESRGCYLEALEWYRLVQEIAPLLDPESRYRQINCFNRIGLYRQALEMCYSFQQSPPNVFDQNRYEELRRLANREQELLEACLSEEFL